MKRTKLGLMIFVLLLLATVVPASGESQISVHIDGSELSFPDARPFIEEGRTLVPISHIARALGSEVAWNPDTRIVGFQKGSDIILLQIGSRSVTINGDKHTIDVPAKISESRTYVPLKFVSEALGAKVEWVAATRTVLITTGEEVVVTPPPAQHVQELSQAEIDRLFSQYPPTQGSVKSGLLELPLEQRKTVVEHVRRNAEYTAVVHENAVIQRVTGQYSVVGIAQKIENGVTKQADAVFVVNFDFRNNNALTSVATNLASDWR